MESGGFDELVYSQLGIVAWWAAVLGCLAGALAISSVGRWGWVGFALLAALAGWTLAGLIWSSSAERTTIEVARTLSYLGVFAVALLIGGAVMGVFVNGMMGGYGALMAELYPTAARATAQNVLFNVGRGIGGFGPVAVGAAALAWGFPAALAGVASLYVLDILATLFLIPEAAGAELV